MLDQIATILAAIERPGTFAAKRSCPADGLRIEVKGVGPVRLPVSARTAARLRSVAQRAPFGLRNRTLIDERVRNTWKIPRHRIRIDGRRWNGVLRPILEKLRAELGLPEGIELKPELHDMLLYEKGQFFEQHQDSEKSDDMIGTLVVTLPSKFTGGASVIEHQGERLTARGSTRALQLVAFYADCRHEVRPVTSGHRVVLTYNLNAKERSDAATEAPAAKVEALASALESYFGTPVPPRWGEGAAEVPDRLVYLLDHEYTAGGLGWNRLKNGDAVRVAALREAAERLDCEIFLALADVQETWDCEPEYDPWYGGGSWYGRGRYDDDDEGDEPYEDEDAEGGDRYTLLSLIEETIELRSWVGLGAKKPVAISSSVRNEELCYTKPSKEIKPFRSEYEGYMGNYGNTVDRWYHRAAMVLWPRERSFVIRAKASPSTAIMDLSRLVKREALEEARKRVETLRPFWSNVARYEQKNDFAHRTLQVAAQLGSPEPAALLLAPLRLEQLGTSEAKLLIDLIGAYGLDWTRDRFDHWLKPRLASDDERHGWLLNLPRFSAILSAAGDDSRSVGRWLIGSMWGWLGRSYEDARSRVSPCNRAAGIERLVAPTLALLQATIVVDDFDLRARIVGTLTSADDDDATRFLVRLLRAAHVSSGPRGMAELGLAEAREQCVRWLEQRLAEPERTADDWSISVTLRCSCRVCATLDEFLSSRRRMLEWPLAKEGRRHIHSEIELHALPVDHQTTRKGRPYTLVLRKTNALFEDDATMRRSWGTDLDWLRSTTRAADVRGRGGSSHRVPSS